MLLFLCFAFVQLQCLLRYGGLKQRSIGGLFFRFRRVVESSMTSTSGRDGQDPELLGGSKDELYGEPATFLGRWAVSPYHMHFLLIHASPWTSSGLLSESYAAPLCDASVHLNCFSVFFKHLAEHKGFRPH